MPTARPEPATRLAAITASLDGKGFTLAQLAELDPLTAFALAVWQSAGLIPDGKRIECVEVSP